MSTMVPIRFDEEMLTALRSRSARDEVPVAQVVKSAVRAYLGMGVEEAVPVRKSERSSAEPVCRDCGHKGSVHTSAAVSSGSGCVFMGCACRRFRGK